MTAELTYLFIDGKRAPASTDATFDVVNPFSKSVVGRAAAASSPDCRRAIESASCAFKAWEATALKDRQAIFLRAADLLETNKYQSILLQKTQAETAAPKSFILGINASAPTFLRKSAHYVEVLNEDTHYPSDRLAAPSRCVEQRRAMGVILAISPWNAPFYLSLRAIVIPILCGNTVVLKPSEYTPATQSLVVDLFEEAGLPAGVLNFVTMTRDDAPRLTAEIIAHPAVRKLNFTGSERVGRLIAAEAGKHLKPCVLELGGKAPTLVLDDADIDKAAKTIAVGAFVHGGQVCMSTCRVIAQRGIYQPLLDKICAIASAMKAGDPLDEASVNMSALFTDQSAENAIQAMSEAQQQGAKVMLGDLQRKGSVVQAHVLTGATPTMEIWKKETFGPDLLVNVFDELEEGIKMANDSDYSLSSALWTRDLDSAESIARQIHAGYVNVNGTTIHGELKNGVMGLAGSSGYGRFAVDDFTDKRLVVYHAT